MTSEDRTFVVTCRVPRALEENLEVTVVGRAVVAASPGGFRHEFVLPREARDDGLEWLVFEGVLEVRTPYGSAR